MFPQVVGTALDLVQLPSAVMTDKTGDKHAAREQDDPVTDEKQTRWKLKSVRAPTSVR